MAHRMFIAWLLAGVAMAGDTGLTAAAAWSDQAALHMTRGEYDEARRLYARALPVFETELGRDHSLTLQTLGNLCVASSHSPGTIDAKPLCARALESREKALGPCHPDVARSLSDLGVLYAGEGDLRRAEALLGRAVSIASSLPEFTDMPGLWNNLGFLYFRKKEFGAAVRCFERALASAGDTDAPTIRTNLEKAEAAGGRGRRGPIVRTSLHDR